MKTIYGSILWLPDLFYPSTILGETQDCGKSPVIQRKKVISCQPSQLRKAFLERLSLSGVSRVFFISYYQVFRALNLECLLLPNFKSQVSPCPPGRPVLQFDELCSFCGRKKDKQLALGSALSK